MANEELKAYFKKVGIKHYQIADALGIIDTAFSKMLRKPFDTKTDTKLRMLADELAEGKKNSVYVYDAKKCLGLSNAGKTNSFIRGCIDDSGLKYYEVADELGISSTKLSKLLRTPLSDEWENAVFQAVQRASLKKEVEEGRSKNE